MTTNVAAEPRLAGRRLRRIIAVAAVAGLATVGLAASPSQAQTTQCTGYITSVIVPGTVEVPAGWVCTLEDVLVTGDVQVLDGADIFINNSTINGTLDVGANAFATVVESTVNDGTQLRDSFGLSAESSSLLKGVDVRDSGFFLSVNSNHTGQVFSWNGWTFIEQGQVAGGVRSLADEATDVVESAVAFYIKVHDASAGSVICETNVLGLVGITSSDGVIQIGGDQPNPACGSNTIFGGLQLYENTAPAHVSTNLVVGVIDCQNNTTAPTGSNNLVIGPQFGQCSGLDGAGGTISGLGAGVQEVSPESRKAAIQALINQRLEG
jgi:hypothetical protein